MASAAERVVPCGALTRRARYLGGDAEPDLLAEAQLATTSCWFCVRTLDSVGPDEAQVLPEDCVAGRACYQGPALV